MGKLLNGLYGPLVGTTSNVTSYMLNGQNVTRMVRHKRTKTSEGQKNNEMRMKLINDFFRSMKKFLKAGFSEQARNTTKNYYNIAVSYNKINALKGVYPDLDIDYPNVLLSDGYLLAAENPAVIRTAEGLAFTWDTDGYFWENGSDQVMVLAYFPEAKRTSTFVYGAKRMEGKELLPLPTDLMEQPAHVYISFVSADRTEVARSTYLGEV